MRYLEQSNLFVRHESAGRRYKRARVERGRGNTKRVICRQSRASGDRGEIRDLILYGLFDNRAAFSA